MALNIVHETDIFKKIRQRSFSHWPRTSPSQAQMIEAGFFSCNIGDRVICIYCNLICQQWTPHTDDLCEIHKTVSPNCIYVKTKLRRREPGSILIANETAAGSASNDGSVFSNNLDQLRGSKFIGTAACNAAYAEMPKRAASFATWSNDNLPAVDDLVQAGFFYTGTKSIVTCFYCNGSLQNWGPNDNPTIEHARWFPHCAYAKQLCGDALYRKIQEWKRVQQECARTNESKEKPGSTSVSADGTTSNRRRLFIPDENTLSRLVTARLDLPISQRLLDQNFRFSIIKRCWEDQLRLKHDDFATDSDLYMACLILQKQIEHINGKKENIVIPHEWVTNWKKSRSTDLRLHFLIHFSTGLLPDFAEDEATTIQREQSFIQWPYSSPSAFDMVTAGWYRIATELGDITICFHCGARYDNWNVNTNPYLIHRERSPLCPFSQSYCPIRPNAIPVKPIGNVFTQQKIAADVNQPTSNIILTSNAPYCRPYDRATSFHRFPSGHPLNADALVNSGFYYTGIGTSIRCYQCRHTVNDFHSDASHNINSEHLRRSPLCRFAQLSIDTRSTIPYNAQDQCKWCWKNPRKFVIDPCMHFAICDSCATLMHICPVCGTKAQNFMKIFS